MDGLNNEIKLKSSLIQWRMGEFNFMVCKLCNENGFEVHFDPFASFSSQPPSSSVGNDQPSNNQHGWRIKQ